MLYSIVRPLAAIGLKANYRKIFLSHRERIPKNKPVILAANHPTAFLEPCLLACYLDRPLYFLVRGDLFKEKWKARLLNMLHMLPVYRMKDGGYQNLKNNYATFEICFQALRERKTLMILAEGRTIHEKRLRPLKKGLARIAFGALEQNPSLEDILIVPVGVNFTYADRPRTEVMIDFEEPISARQYFVDYPDNPNKAIAGLTDELRKRLEKNVIIIDHAADDALVEQWLVLHRFERKHPRFPVISGAWERLQMEKSVADRINRLAEADKAALKGKTQAYFDQLQSVQLPDRVVIRPGRSLGWRVLLLVLGSPLFLAGLLWSYIPLKLPRWVVDQRVRLIEFYEPTRVAVALGTFSIWGIITLLVAWQVAGWWSILVLAALLSLAYFAVVYREAVQVWQEDRRWWLLPGPVRDQLHTSRGQLTATWQALEGRAQHPS